MTVAWPVQCATCQGRFLSHDAVCLALSVQSERVQVPGMPQKLQALGSQLVGQTELQANPLNHPRTCQSHSMPLIPGVSPCLTLSLPALQVSIMEDEDSNIHMRNLSIHRANNEEEALNLVGHAPKLMSPACTTCRKGCNRVHSTEAMLLQPHQWQMQKLQAAPLVH